MSLADTAPILAVVLAGGRSKRMGQDKASLVWRGQSLWRRQAELLRSAGLEVALSVRVDQQLPEFTEGEFELIIDQVNDAGPLTGFLSAWAQRPECALLMVACDLPLLDAATIQQLLENRDATKWATAFNSANDDLPEPLCAIYEPTARPILEAAVANDRRCPRKLLIEGGDDVCLLALANAIALENANTPEELERLKQLQEAHA